MRVLPDTSIWVDYLRRGASGSAGELDRLLETDSVLVCGPVLAELLAGTPAEQRDELWLALGSLPWADLDHTAWREVGELANDLHCTGTPVALTDLAIAIACVRAEATLWTRDRDFERVKDVLHGLQLHSS